MILNAECDSFYFGKLFSYQNIENYSFWKTYNQMGGKYGLYKTMIIRIFYLYEEIFCYNYEENMNLKIQKKYFLK